MLLPFGTTLAGACLVREVSKEQPTTKISLDTRLPLQGIDKLDLLVVVDNSTSMRDKQLILADALPGPSLGLATGVMRLTADVGWLLGPLALGGVAASLGTGATVVVAASVPLTNLLLLAARGPGGIPAGGPGAPAMRS